MPETNPADIASLLDQHAAWLRRLATYLVRDGVDAEDMVQETWEAALAAPPHPDRPLRPWLARVLHNAVLSAARSRSRRSAREAETARLAGEAPAAEELLGRMELHGELARLMAALEEPYRTTLLLRFYDGRSAADIARAEGIPAGTVRWRLNEGIKRLRARLDALYGERGAWRAILIPLAAAPSPAQAPSLRRWPTTAALGGGAAALLVVGAWVVSAERAPPAPAVPARPLATSTAPAAAPASAPRPASSPRPLRPERDDLEEDTMSKENVRRLAAFFGVMLPALAASAQESTDPKIQQGIDLCVQMRERLFECKEEFADSIIVQRNPPPEQRDALRRKAIEEIVKDGSGPLEPRQKACAAMAKPGQSPSAEWLAKMKQAMDGCVAKPDCKARVACFAQVSRPGQGKPAK
jgi:RNA polymerase sigma factor (sigma-70 family)